MPVEPITPNDVDALKKDVFPEEVLKVFNKHIALNWDGRRSTVYQRGVLNEISDEMDITRDEVLRRKLLDVEPIYRKAGWKVEYDKPAYCENYQPFFIFSK